MRVRRYVACVLVFALGGGALYTKGGPEESELPEEPELEAENEALKERLKLLEGALTEERKWGYTVVKGLIVEAENVFMETMEVDEAKRYCNSRPECKGFTFGGPEERPEDEVTVTFKSGSKIEHDVNWVSYVKESAAGGAFGAIGDAAMQIEHNEHGVSIVSQVRGMLVLRRSWEGGRDGLGRRACRRRIPRRSAGSPWRERGSDLASKH